MRRARRAAPDPGNMRLLSGQPAAWIGVPAAQLGLPNRSAGLFPVQHDHEESPSGYDIVARLKRCCRAIWMRERPLVPTTPT